MLDKIIIVDFEDSFTYNIAEVIYPLNQSCKVVPYLQFFEVVAPQLLKTKTKHAVILGPGPGHPDDYLEVQSFIKDIILHPQIYVLGICLGHQLIGKSLGLAVRRVDDQMHGVSTIVNFKQAQQSVQRYNSLGVFDHDGVQNILYFPLGISYQFHPESVGTESPHVFFEDLLNFLN